VAARTVPVARHRLGVDGGRDVEVLGDAVEQPAGDPHVVAHLDDAGGADLELPLAHHHLGVDAGELQAGLEAGVHVGLDDLAAVDLVGADAAVVGALGAGEAAAGPAEGVAVLEERVLLLHAEPHVLVGVLLGRRGARSPGVGGVRGHVDVEHLVQHEDVVAAADRVGADEHGLEHAVGGVALGLVGGGAVEAPHGRLLAVLQDPGLRAQQRRRLGAVDPDVFSLDAHGSGAFRKGRGAGYGHSQGRVRVPRFSRM
jgi:hypothetical protein